MNTNKMRLAVVNCTLSSLDVFMRLEEKLFYQRSDNLRNLHDSVLESLSRKHVLLKWSLLTVHQRGRTGEGKWSVIQVL